MNMIKRVIRITNGRCNYQSDPFTHFVSLLQLAVALDISRIGYASAEEMSLE